MSNRLFQSVIHQMREAVDKTIGVIDETGAVISCSDLSKIGEVRNVNMIEKRIKEAEKMGFKTCIIPESNKKLLKESYKLDIIGVKNIIEAMKVLGLK